MNIYLGKASKALLSIRQGNSQEDVEHNVKFVMFSSIYLLMPASEFLDASQRAKFPSSFYFEASEVGPLAVCSFFILAALGR
jgi:hypothetical protein